MNLATVRRAALALAFLLGARSAAAQERVLLIERFHADVVVNRDASIDVTEEIAARFTGSWNGIYRTVPVAYHTPQGFNWTLRLELLSATDERGNRLKVESKRERHYQKYKIWVPNAVDASHTITLKYRARNGLRFFEDHDELYWNLTGDEWDVPVGYASGVVHLPAATDLGIRATAFNGAYGSTARDAEVKIEANEVSVTMQQPLGYREGLTVVVGWNKGLVTEPGAGEKAAGFLAANWPLFIPIPVFLLMFRLWRARGKDPDPLPVTVQYDPPAGLTPAEAGTLIDNSVDMRDITATLVDLAVRGYVRIEETKETKLFGLIDKDDYAFHLLKPPGDWRDLKAHEMLVLSGIFNHGAERTVALSDLENEFYKSLPPIKDGVFDILVTAGFYQKRPDSVRGGWMAFGLFAGIALAGGGAAISGALSMTPVPFLVAGVLTGLILLFFGYHMPARTVKGARTGEQVAGFLEFLNRVEGDRLRDFVKTPEMFERFLPFAMAFGVEKKWARRSPTSTPNRPAGTRGRIRAGSMPTPFRTGSPR
ncbi:MAG: DUF2207 domain-containing protein [Gemmatimonadales bacterium]